MIRDAAAARGVEAIVRRHWAEGGGGAKGLARAVAAVADQEEQAFAPLYADDVPLFAKIEVVATRVYRAGEVLASPAVRAPLARWEREGHGRLPVCIAKTQYSFSTDSALLGAPTGHAVTVREVWLAAGAGFVVAICGELTTMPGLSRHPAAEVIRLTPDGVIEGLF